jgi:hypothetical protein
LLAQPAQDTRSVRRFLDGKRLIEGFYAGLGLRRLGGFRLGTSDYAGLGSEA